MHSTKSASRPPTRNAAIPLQMERLEGNHGQTWNTLMTCRTIDLIKQRLIFGYILQVLNNHNDDEHLNDAAYTDTKSASSDE